jgi:hypothetical protein
MEVRRAHDDYEQHEHGHQLVHGEAALEHLAQLDRLGYQEGAGVHPADVQTRHEYGVCPHGAVRAYRRMDVSEKNGHENRVGVEDDIAGDHAIHVQHRSQYYVSIAIFPVGWDEAYRQHENEHFS